MECDVIPDCSQEIDPLDNLENCDTLSDESCNYGGSLNAQIISSTDNYIVQTDPVKAPTISFDNNQPSRSAIDETDGRGQKTIKTGQSTRKSVSQTRTATGTATEGVSSTASIVSVPLTLPPTSPIGHTTQASTMREVLASIPGFCVKPRRRSNKKMSTAAQLEQTREGCIDLETSDSILVSTNLRDLLNRHTFSLLPPLYQYKLVQLLPNVDRPPIDPESPIIRLNSSSLNNEFFARACLEWRERLSEGEFTPENQLKLKTEAEKEKSKLDPWKLKHFEPIWGDNGQSNNIKLLADDSTDGQSLKVSTTNSASSNAPFTATTITQPEMISSSSSIVSTSINSSNNYTTSSGRLVKSPSSYNNVSYCNAQKRQRTVGAVTRSSTASVGQNESPTKTPTQVPDLLPLRTKTPKPLSTPMTQVISNSRSTDTSIGEMSIVQSTIKIDTQQQHQDIAIIATTVNSNKQMDKKIPYEDIKPDIELIPIPNISSKTMTTTSITTTTISTTTNIMNTIDEPSPQPKRAPKRSVSPDTCSTKMSKISDSTNNVVEAIAIVNSSVCTPVTTTTISLISESSGGDGSGSSGSGSGMFKEKINFETLTQTTTSNVSESTNKVKTFKQFDDIAVNTSRSNVDTINPVNVEKKFSDSVPTSVQISSVASTVLATQTKNFQPQLDDLLTAPIFAGDEEIKIESENDNTINVKHEPDIELSDVHLYQTIKENVDLELANIKQDSDVQQNSTESSEYSNDINSLSAENVTDKFDSNFNSNETDSLTSFCTDNIKLDNIYKIQNFEGVLQIQPNALTLEQDDRGDLVASLVTDRNAADMMVVSSIRCDDSSNSTAALADCSGENSADTGVEELEPSIQNLEPIEDDPIDQKFTDAENYVLESGEISRDSGEANSLPVDSKLCSSEDIQAKIFAEAMARAFDSVPGNAPVAMTVVSPTDNTEVIPMQETLEVRLKESTYQVISDWPTTYTVKSEDLPSNVIESNDTSYSDQQSMHILNDQNQSQDQQQVHPIYSTASQVKLELEVTLTPEGEVSSTVASNNSTNSCDSDQSNEDTIKSNPSNTIPTVIPPTTIVCLPSLVTVPNSVSHQTTNMQSTYASSQATAMQQKQFVSQNAYSVSNNQRNPSASAGGLISQPRTAVVASSSSIPYLSIATTQPLRAVSNATVQNRHKLPTKGGRGSRANSNRPPPGAVNLERSYQICQAVIQNSPNRHQLKAQLRPPPSLLSTTNSTVKKEENVSSTIKVTNGQPRITFSKKGFVQRQPSPVLVRHVFTTNQGIPVSMAVLPSGVNQQTNQSDNQQQQLGSINQSGQYILVQRAGVVPGENHAPRASSAPPAQNQPHSASGVPIAGRGRPASVDVDNHNANVQEVQHYIEASSGVQTITRKVPNQGFVYSDISMDTSYPHYSISGENTPPNCACSLNAMVICQQCGVFCHDECMGSSKLCLSCVIR